MGLIPCGGSEGESAPCFSPGFRWLLTMLGTPWLVAALQYLHQSSYGFSLCVCVSFSDSYKDTCHWIFHLNSG